MFCPCHTHTESFKSFRQMKNDTVRKEGKKTKGKSKGRKNAGKGGGKKKREKGEGIKREMEELKMNNQTF